MNKSKEPTVGLAIICRNNKDWLRITLPVFKLYFDQIVVVDTGSTDGSKKIAKQFADVYDHNPKTNPESFFEDGSMKKFCDPRNTSFAHLKTDWAVWIDTDDILVGIENIRGVIDWLEEQGATVAEANYVYAWSNSTNSPYLEQPRDRIFKDPKRWRWVGWVHELTMPDDNSYIVRRRIEKDVLDWQHQRDDRSDEDAKRSNDRNLKILEAKLAETKGKEDPRDIYYYGLTLMGNRHHLDPDPKKNRLQEAIQMFQWYLKVGGWDEEKYRALLNIHRISIMLGLYQQAATAALAAMDMKPTYPEGQIALAEAYYNQKRYNDAIYWTKSGLKLKQADMVLNDRFSYQVKPLIILADCYYNLNKPREAMIVLQKLREIMPDHDDVVASLQEVTDKVNTENYIKCLETIERYLSKYDPTKLKSLVDIVPKSLESSLSLQLRAAYGEPKKWSDKSIVIFCGDAFEDWAPPSIITGIGGSETAVINIGKELSKLGWEVTVYNRCGKLCRNYDGVDYRPFYEINLKDEFNIFIEWRSVQLSPAVKAKLKVVWAHDTTIMAQSKDMGSFADKFFFLSKYHRSLFPWIPEDKVFYTNNGVDVAMVKDVEKTSAARDPYKMVNTSSYDRGVEHILKHWSRIKQEVPEATLDIYYGWNTFDKLRADDVNAQAWKKQMVELMKQDGVTEMGRVGQRKLVRALLEAGYFTSANHFEEINNISLQQAQVCGAYPIATDYAANQERLLVPAISGSTNEKEAEYIEHLINCLKSGLKMTTEDIKKARKDWSWEATAKQWHKLFSKK